MSAIHLTIIIILGVTSILLILFYFDAKSRSLKLASIVMLGLFAVSLISIPILKFEERFDGEARVTLISYNPPYSKKNARQTIHYSECFSVISTPLIDNPDPDKSNQWIQGDCIPEEFWKLAEEGDTVLIENDEVVALIHDGETMYF